MYCLLHGEERGRNHGEYACGDQGHENQEVELGARAFLSRRYLGSIGRCLIIRLAVIRPIDRRPLGCDLLVGCRRRRFRGGGTRVRVGIGISPDVASRHVERRRTGEVDGVAVDVEDGCRTVRASTDLGALPGSSGLLLRGDGTAACRTDRPRRAAGPILLGKAGQARRLAALAVFDVDHDTVDLAGSSALDTGRRESDPDSNSGTTSQNPFSPTADEQVAAKWATVDRPDDGQADDQATTRYRTEVSAAGRPEHRALPPDSRGLDHHRHTRHGCGPLVPPAVQCPQCAMHGEVRALIIPSRIRPSWLQVVGTVEAATHAPSGPQRADRRATTNQAEPGDESAWRGRGWLR